MKILLNGEWIQSTAKNLYELCISLGYDIKTIVTAQNGEFVARTEREHIPLNDNDHIEILTPMQGG